MKKPNQITKTLLSAITAVGILLTTVGIGTTAAYANPTTYKQQIHSQTNTYRTNNGLGNVYASPYLDQIAQSWANYLASSGEYKHNPNLSNTVFSQPGWTAVAENLVAQRPDGTQAMQAWINSDGHRANLLGNYDRIGIGIATGGQYGTYYVQVFGKNPSDPSANLYGAPLLPTPEPPKPTTPPPVVTPPKPEPPKPPVVTPPTQQPPTQQPPTTKPPTQQPPTPTTPKEEPKNEQPKTETPKREETDKKKDPESKQETDKKKDNNDSKDNTDTDTTKQTPNSPTTDENLETVQEPTTQTETLPEVITEQTTNKIADLNTRGQTYLQANLNNPLEMSKNITILGGTLILFATIAALANRQRKTKT